MTGRIPTVEETRAYLARKRTEGKTTREAIRCLKRHLARRIWRLLQPAANPNTAAITIHCNTPHSRFSLT